MAETKHEFDSKTSDLFKEIGSSLLDEAGNVQKELREEELESIYRSANFPLIHQQSTWLFTHPETAVKVHQAESVTDKIKVALTDPRIQLRWNCSTEMPEIRNGKRWCFIGESEADILRYVLGDRYGVKKFTQPQLRTALLFRSQENPFKPLKDWLSRRQWDGKTRVKDLFKRYFCSVEKDMKIIERYGEMFMVSLLARTERPGAKVDTMFILIGHQGAKKSSGLSALVPEEDLFGTIRMDPTKKDTFIAFIGKHLIEVAELNGFDRASQEALKAAITVERDVLRLPYDRGTKNIPRTAILVGSTNIMHPIGSDITGARRFPCIYLESIDIQAIRDDREQLWAEARELYLSGVKWWLSTPSEIADSEDYQSQFMYEREWEHTAVVALQGFADGFSLSRLVDLLKQQGVVEDKDSVRGAIGRQLASWLVGRGFVRRRRGSQRVWFRSSRCRIPYNPDKVQILSVKNSLPL